MAAPRAASREADAPRWSLVSLSRWVWRSYLHTTIWPLVVVEVALVAIYLATSVERHRRSLDTLERISTDEVSRIARRETANVVERLRGIEALTEVLRREAARALSTPRAPPPDERAAYALLEDGRFVTTRDYGGGALFYSGRVPIGEAQREKAHRSGRLDPVLEAVVRASPAVVQTYINTWDSMNRIYPYLDAAKQFPAGLDLTKYNFYYEADATHNPDRDVVWTDAYLDPAGQGWIVSSLAPVYIDGALEAVAGIDVTLDNVIEHVLDLDLPWDGYGFLVAEDGTAIALPRAAEADWGLTELGEHEYRAAILQDTLKPADFNLFQRSDLSDLADLVQTASVGAGELALDGARLASWATIPSTGWKLVLLIDRSAVNAPADLLRQESMRIGALMVAGMVAFYACFLAFLFRRAHRDSRRLAAPLEQIDRMVARMGAGQHRQPRPRFEIEEIDRTAAHIVDMGEQMARHVETLESTQADLQAATRRAEAASRAKSEFLASMSHELRTPLNGVLGMAQMIERTELHAEQRRYVEVIASSAQALVELIGDILDLSKIEAGRLELHPEPFELGPWLREVADLFAFEAENKGLALRLSAPDAVEVTTDRVRLRQVLVNLLGNAVKFTEAGFVELAVSPAPAPGDAGWRFVVRDSGPGISAGDQARVFEAFRQADQTATRRHGGTGLGLAISARIVRMLGGELRLDSAPGVGSAFAFELALPTRALEGPAAGSAETDAQTEARSLRILVAEDNPINQELIVALLEMEGHEVALAEDGAAALALLDERTFDVALVDLHMPVMDGLELARAVRRRPEARDLPMVALTASATLEDRVACQDAGMDDFLTKPVDVDVLRSTLGRQRAGG